MGDGRHRGSLAIPAPGLGAAPRSGEGPGAALPPPGSWGCCWGRSWSYWWVIAGRPRQHLWPHRGTHPGLAASRPGRWCWFSQGHRWLCGERRVSGDPCWPPPSPAQGATHPTDSSIACPRGPSAPGVPAVGLAAPAADDQDAGEQDQGAPDEDGEQGEEQHVAILGGHLTRHRLHRVAGAEPPGGTRSSPKPCLTRVGAGAAPSRTEADAERCSPETLALPRHPRACCRLRGPAFTKATAAGAVEPAAAPAPSGSGDGTPALPQRGGRCLQPPPGQQPQL